MYILIDVQMQKYLLPECAVSIHDGSKFVATFRAWLFFTSGYRGLSFEVFGLLTKLLFCIGRDVDFFLCSKD